jgi:hypothetical protein
LENTLFSTLLYFEENPRKMQKALDDLRTAEFVSRLATQNVRDQLDLISKSEKMDAWADIGSMEQRRQHKKSLFKQQVRTQIARQFKLRPIREAAARAAEEVVRARSVVARLQAERDASVKEIQRHAVEEAERERVEWRAHARAAIWWAHVHAASARRWSPGGFCNDSVDDLDCQGKRVPSTYGRRYQLIMDELDRAPGGKYLPGAFRARGYDRNDFVREAVKHGELPRVDVQAINAYLNVQRKKENEGLTDEQILWKTFPALNPDWTDSE